MTLIEVLMAVSIVSMLAASVGTAVKGSLQGYADNTAIADLAQASRTAATKILGEVRLADDANSSTGLLRIYTNAAKTNGTIYQIVSGSLQYNPLVGGVVGAPEPLIGSDGQITVEAFSIVREENAQLKTISVSVYLKLTSGNLTYESTFAAAVRKNQTY
jgi:type II secretory pathway pseudopilin PulG